ncbi:MAG: hypothetical protein V3T53_09715 [Phycisphaerales bacterium]
MTIKGLGLSMSLLLLWGGAGCTGPVGHGSLRAQSLGDDPVALEGEYITAFYADGSSVETSFVLSDVGLDQLLGGQISRGQVVRIDLLWVPKPGATPMDSSATNASIRYVIVTDGELGVYVGAGFAMPQGDASGASLTVRLRDGSLVLLESTDGFVDLLSPATLTGSFTATHNDQRARQLSAALRRLVNNALGSNRRTDATTPIDRRIARLAEE